MYLYIDTQSITLKHLYQGPGGTGPWMLWGIPTHTPQGVRQDHEYQFTLQTDM